MVNYSKMDLEKFVYKTTILPHIIASNITADERMQEWLVDRLLTICEHNPTFFKRCCGGDSGRNYVYLFMEHWLESFTLQGEN